MRALRTGLEHGRLVRGHERRYRITFAAERFTRADLELNAADAAWPDAMARTCLLDIDDEDLSEIEAGQYARFTRSRALRWMGPAPLPRLVVDARWNDGVREITFDGVLWGPAKHFEVVEPNRVEASIAADRAARAR